MKQNAPTPHYPPHPAHIDAFVSALGPALAVEFLIQFAGCSLYFPDDPKGRSEAEALIGRDRLIRLGEMLPNRRHEIPIPRTWLVHALDAEGHTTAEIIRKLRCSRTTVQNARKLLPNRATPAPEPISRDDIPEGGQLPLFD
ncbi:helix-turn-helix domain-containing protein [uncultured Tateyamaria sp.]|uniref:helix-turn-helix domain-containing protein n=1 Tax=uncultured Tateyamaria sp. TaxID=455651 RepID=UPI002622E0EB|nr:helix-turn-helix domain-containing protein [uncultured Tateyamaria sp.]